MSCPFLLQGISPDQGSNQCLLHWQIDPLPLRHLGSPINPVLVILFANSFSNSVGCLFILLIVSFGVQKLLSLIRYYLFIFEYVGDIFKKLLLQFISKTVLPMFSSRSFTVSGLALVSLIHFLIYFCI